MMMKRLFQQVKDSRKLFVISVIFGCLGGLVLIAEAYYVANIVDDVFLKGFGLAEVKLLLALLLGVIVIRGLLHMVSDYSATKLAQGIKSQLRITLIEKLGELGPQYNKGERSGELVSTVYEGVEQLENYLAKYVPQIVLSMFVPFAVFIVVVGQDAISAIVYAITLPLLILFMILIGKYTKARTDRQYKLLGRLGGHFQEILRGLETLKIFNRSKAQLNIIDKISDEHRRSTMATLRLAFLSAFVMELFATISTAVIAVFLGLRLVEGQMEFYHAFLILLLTPEFYAPIRALGTQFHSGMNGASAATRIFQILDEQPQGYVENANGVKLDLAANEGARITFENVTLHYKGYESPALNNVSFTLEPGKQLAIVGATGAGKSTILDLIQGFIKPTSGIITINGHELADMSMEHWRKKLCTVSQNVHLFNGTIRENILLGLEDISDEQVCKVLRDAGANQFISQLPEGLDTRIDDQIRLSGGQIQRIAIARAMLRADANVILLDEATNGLDVYNEGIVSEQLQQFMKDKTSIVVAHHLETIASADYVMVLQQGEVVEFGTTEQLVKSNGKFAQMLQANEIIDSSAEDMVESIALMQSNLKKLSNQESIEFVERLESSQDQDSVQTFSKQTFINAMKHLMKFLAQYKWLAMLSIVLSFATIAANIGLMGTSGYLIAKAALRPENVLMIYVPIVGVRFFGISRSVLRYLERLASHNVTFKVLHRLRVWLYEKIEPNGATLFQRKRSGDVLGSVVSDIEQLQNFYLRLFAPPIVYALTVVLAVGFLSTLHYSLAIALLVMLMIAGIVIPYVSYKQSKERGVELVTTRVKLYEQTLDLLRGMTTIQQYGILEQKQKEIEVVQQNLNDLQTKEHRNTAISTGMMTFVTQFAMWVLLIVSIPLVVQGVIAPYMLPAILLLTLASFEAAAPLPQAFQMSSGIATAANRLFALAEEQEKANQTQRESVRLEGTHLINANESDVNMNGQSAWSCSLQNVQFRYDNSERPALSSIDLELVKGKKLAIVGESGAGKSTLLQAILKLRPITSGSIVMNDINYDAMSDEEVRDHFSVVSQNVQLFNATVAENIRLGNQQATLEEIRQAAKIAEIDSFIMSLPEGYDTFIGEYGAKLSGGQRQRLALARAIVRESNALLFDEPATGLDVLTQKAFHENMNDIMQQKAVLWITHKLTDVVNMDEIIVLSKGIVVERGTHEQLLAAKGYYYYMWCLERSRDWEKIVS